MPPLEPKGPGRFALVRLLQVSEWETAKTLPLLPLRGRQGTAQDILLHLIDKQG